MLNLGVDIGELEHLVSSALERAVSLELLKLKCTYPVFKCCAVGKAAPLAFVKVGLMSEWRQTHWFLSQVGDEALFGRLLVNEPIEYRGFAVFIAEWRETNMILPEDFQAAEVEQFVDGCVRLNRALSKLDCNADAIDALQLSPELLYQTVSEYCQRHRCFGRLLKALLAIPESERSYGVRQTVVIHGDFHARNFGFAGAKLASVFDFDKLTLGLPCSDLVNALVSRYAVMSLSAAVRCRLMAVARQIFAAQPWPREDLVIAINVLRLWHATRRIRKHPHSALIALDILRRDRKLRAILDALPVTLPVHT